MLCGETSYFFFSLQVFGFFGFLVVFCWFFVLFFVWVFWGFFGGVCMCVCVSLYIIKVGVNLELMQFLEYTVYTLKTQARLAASVKLSHLIS